MIIQAGSLYTGDLARWDRARARAFHFSVDVAISNIVPCTACPAHQERAKGAAYGDPGIHGLYAFGVKYDGEH
jgi:hypothetical protein